MNDKQPPKAPGRLSETGIGLRVTKKSGETYVIGREDVASDRGEHGDRSDAAAKVPGSPRET